MNKNISKIRDYTLQLLYDHNFIISILITCIIYFVFRDFFITYFMNNESKSSAIEMILSLSGTLFGFILTFLSIFLVFKTEDKYKKKENESNSLILFINNPSFNEIYKIFINCSYFLGLLIILCIIFYFFNTIYTILIEIFTFIFLLLIIKSIIYVFLSLYLFNRLINIVIQKN